MRKVAWLANGKSFILKSDITTEFRIEQQNMLT